MAPFCISDGNALSLRPPFRDLKAVITGQAESSGRGVRNDTASIHDEFIGQVSTGESQHDSPGHLDADIGVHDRLWAQP